MPEFIKRTNEVLTNEVLEVDEDWMIRWDKVSPMILKRYAEEWARKLQIIYQKSWYDTRGMNHGKCNTVIKEGK